VHVADGTAPRASYALGEAADLHTQGRFSLPVQQLFHLAEAADAHRLSEHGHVRGRIVLTIP
jgi:NADPH:quinone reductase-like Zn-dependent oxidoreductase